MAQGISRFFEVYPDVVGATMPLGVSVDDVIYANGLIGANPVSGALADGLVAQTQLALDQLKDLVEGAGASIDNIGRAVAFVTKVEDRDAVYGPWDAMFPNENDRPAFKVLVGSLPPGQLVQIDGLAVHGRRRKRTDIDGVSARDPSVCLGDWLFTSRVHGIEPHKGVPQDPHEEAVQTFRNLVTLLDLNGFKPSDLAQITLFCTDAQYFDTAQRAYEQVFADAATRPPLQRLISFIVPRFKFSVEMIARRNVAEPQLAFQEIYLAPAGRPIPAGARIGSLLIAPALTSADPVTSIAAGDQEAQLRSAMVNAAAFLEAGGASMDHLARATFYMPNVDDRTAMNTVWQCYYPDENKRPPNKYAPAALPQGHLARLQILAIPGNVSRTLEIPGLKHQDWMSMGALTGNLLTSSRLFGSHAFNKGRAKDEIEATELAFGHATTLLAQAGSDWSKIAQISAFIGDPGHREPVLAAWRKATQGNRNAPRLNIVEWQWGAAGTPRIEIVAIL